MKATTRKAFTRKELAALRATIKGFTAEAKDIRRKYILPNHGPKRDAAWNAKRNLGHYARVHLLAYALLRGKKREDLEKPANGKWELKDYERWNLEILARKIFRVCRYYGSYSLHYYREFTEEAIYEWLLGGENTLFQYPDPSKFHSKVLAKKRQKMEKAS